MERRSVGLLIFPEIEVLDFAAPFEVFSRTRLTPGAESRREETSAPFGVFTVGTVEGVIRATGGLQVLPTYSLSSAPAIDILVIPGGTGTRTLVEDETAIGWIRERAARAQQVASVCTGSILLGRAGLLAGRRATTHWSAFERLAKEAPDCRIERDARVVDDGVITSAGVSAGLDMSLALVEKLHGRAVADDVAHYIDYERQGRRS